MRFWHENHKEKTVGIFIGKWEVGMKMNLTEIGF
jgi:hypothetical protein